MRALVFARYGGLDQVAFTDVPTPAPALDELLVRVHAAGINPIDNKILSGAMKAVIPLSLPATVGSDVAGVVVEVGDRVTRFKPGDAVFASIFERRTGALAEFAVVPETAAALKPDRLDFVQAASIPMVGLTAWQSLNEHARLRPGQRVFIPAGSGGIGTFAIQLATHLGATVATTTSAENMSLVRGLGADETIDYKTEKFEERLRDYDVVLGTLGGDSLEKAFQILKPKGILISLVGPPDPAFGRTRGLNVVIRSALWFLSRKVRGLARARDAEYLFRLVRPDGGQLAEIGALLQAGKVRPVIDRVFPFDRAKDALAYLAAGRAKGKIVVRLPDPLPGS
jgi:NADPH:quinone reductase-like Zn-dependent oxidoreductase